MNSSTFAGSAEAKRANASGSTQVAVGLFGSQMMTAFVRGVTAASIASRSWTPSRNGTRTGVAPVIDRVGREERERRIAHHDLVARPDERQKEHQQNLVAAVPEDRVLHRQAVRFGQPRAQRRMIVVGVEVRAGQAGDGR